MPGRLGERSSSRGLAWDALRISRTLARRQLRIPTQEGRITGSSGSKLMLLVIGTREQFPVRASQWYGQTSKKWSFAQVQYGAMLRQNELESKREENSTRHKMFD
jgi:hypothetical protein